MSGGKVFDGKQWVPVANAAGSTSAKSPVAPEEGGDGTIFVVMPSFRDGKRCGDTLKSIFENAKDPDKVVVGLIEQNDPDDVMCLSAYCDSFGVKNVKRTKIRKDVTSVIALKDREKTCPHFDQVRLLAFFNLAAKGPVFSRSMTRKIVGNEQFCLQIDAHTSFVPEWDEIAKEEWLKAGNEFAILSTAPPAESEKQDYLAGGSKHGEVPRQCRVEFTDNVIPNYVVPADGKATGLVKPLLSHTWNPGFSFAKCHLEETTPYDPFEPYMVGAEAFARFARFWTRGYDVYTPTRNFLFHDYGPTPGGHGQQEWYKKWKNSIRLRSLNRVKTFLQIPGGETTEEAQANLGIYGLGKRRTLQMLNQFLSIDLVEEKGNKENLDCAGKAWIPYDSAISPMENLFDKPIDLDPQPIFPLRTELKFYKQDNVEPAVSRMNLGGNGPRHGEDARLLEQNATASSLPPATTLFTLWIFGMVVWCVFFVLRGEERPPPRRKVGGASGVKDV